MGKSPQLITSTGRVITERSAIALYLIETYDTAGKFKIPSPPVDPEYDAIKEDAIISLGNSSLNSVLMTRLVLSLLVKGTPFFARPLVAGVKLLLDKAFMDAEIDLYLSYLDALLEGREYLMGKSDPTRADFVNIWYIEMGYHGTSKQISRVVSYHFWHIS